MARHAVYQRIPMGALRLISGYLRSMVKERQFHIKRGYVHRNEVIAHDDRQSTDEYQREVYEQAARLAKENDLHRVIDVGCGSGYKLITYFAESDTTGIDTALMVGQLRQEYPTRKWISLDEYQPGTISADLIICADVIEHVLEPVAFMRSLLEIREWRCLVISTPERDVKRGWYHYGPPPNPHHFREWNGAEFVKFLSEFVIVEKQWMANIEQGTQAVMCRRRP